MVVLITTTIVFAVVALKKSKSEKNLANDKEKLKATLGDVLGDLKSTKTAIQNWSKDHSKDQAKWKAKEKQLLADNEALQNKVEALNGCSRADLIDLD